MSVVVIVYCVHHFMCGDPGVTGDASANAAQHNKSGRWALVGAAMIWTLARVCSPYSTNFLLQPARSATLALPAGYGVFSLAHLFL